MQFLGNFFKLIFLLVDIYKKLKSQKKFVNAHLSPFVKLVQANSDNSLTDFDYHKVMYYYGVGTPVVLGEGLAKLRGYKLNFQEKKAITYMSAITGLFDDFFDKSNTSKEYISNMMLFPSKQKPANSREKLFLDLTIKALENIDYSDYLKNINLQVLETQWASKNQMNEKLSAKELQELTYKKGGIALLFWRHALQNKIEDNEAEALIKLGEWLQDCNDIFDLNKDLEEGVYTPINKAVHIPDLIIQFKAKMEDTFKSFMGLNYQLKDKISFVNHFKIVGAQSLLCLNQFHKLQIKYSGKFDTSKYTRKEMICDMQKPSNLIKSVYYYLSI